MKFKKVILYLSITLVCYSCGVTRINPDLNLKFEVLDEYIIPPKTFVHGEEIGGLSGIDYRDGKLLLVDDRSTKPIIYEVDFVTEATTIDTLIFRTAINLNQTDPSVFKPISMDLESVRFDPNNSNYWWIANEGNMNVNKNGGVYQLSKEGKFISALELPSYFTATNDNSPRNNGVFEAMDFSIDAQKIVITTELPLVLDAKKPQLWKSYTPIRFVVFDRNSLEAEEAYLYDIDRIVLWPFLPFMINGVTEILSYTDDSFFVLERAFSAGRGKKSNRVKLFLASTTKATNVLHLEELPPKKEVQLMQKDLVLDFKKIRKKLTSKRIDNIEGLCYGPKLPNGNRTLLLISDNNFNTFSNQITQLIWLEIIE